MFELLQAGDVAAATPLLSERLHGELEEGWSLEEYLRDVFVPGLVELTGASRVVISSKILPTAVRLSVEGDVGSALVTIRFDERGAVDGFALDREVIDGIANFVINCPDERVEELEAFYGALLGVDKWRLPMLVFDEGNDYHAPGWDDPDRPQQMHTDIRVRDVAEAEALALAAGAVQLHSAADHVILADPIGHAFCLYPGGVTVEEVGELWRVAIDCPNPSDLATFYEGFLGMTRVEESPANVVISASERLPMLSFQRVSPYVPPQWPDPARPAQMHFDITFDDAPTAMRTAERLGAVRLPPGGGCPVYADPVGHPFCLCMHGQ